MKYKLVLISVTYCFVTAPISMAMEKEKQESNILHQITCIQEPIGVKFLSKNSVAIAGKSGCSIFNLKTKEETKISTVDCSCLAVAFDRKKIAFSYDKAIELYDITTKIPKLKWSKEEEFPIGSLEFSSCGNTIVACLHEDNRGRHRIVKRNFIDDNNQCIHNHNNATVALHPKKQTMCVTEIWGNVWLYDSLDFLTRTTVLPLSHHNNYCCIGANDLIAVIDPDGKTISVIDPNKNNEVWELKGQQGEIFINMAFYPLGSILAVSSAKIGLQGEEMESEDETESEEKLDQYIVRYWDVATKKLLIEIPALPYHWDYSFSFDFTGKKIATAFRDYAEIHRVPWKVRYLGDIVEKFPLLWFLLQCCCDQQDEYIPDDIKRLFIRLLFKTFERRYAA